MTDIFSTVDIQTNDADVSFEALVGEDKPYKTPDDLAKAKRHADAHIARLEREAAEIRQELNKQLTMEELLTQIRSNQTPIPPSNQPVPQNSDVQTPDINALVKQALESQTVESRRKANEAQVTKTLAERFGDGAIVYLNKKAAELSMTVEELRREAQENPTKFYRLVELDRQTPQAPTAVAPRSNSNLPPTSGERERTYWEKVKATNPKEYFSVSATLQRHKDMEKVLKAGKQW